ncbi:MAG TPA: hypothetical protein VFU05_15820 [Cyclobacteriaceae bacterium]|nr:hypothetical protein [Cyclobacteriaceae bacterium]
MSDFSSWWDALSLSLKIYWALAIPFTLFFLLQLVWSFLGGGDVPDDTPDAEVSGDTGVPFQFLTLKNLIAFFTIFSWTGISCQTAGLSDAMTVIVSFGAGLAMMVIMASVFYFIAKANADGTMRIQKAIGGSGEVYLTISKKRGALGKVQIKVQGAVRTLDAVTDDDNDIPTGKFIQVTGIVNDNVLLVTVK